MTMSLLTDPAERAPINRISDITRKALVALAEGPLVAWQCVYVPVSEADSHSPSIRIPSATINSMTVNDMVTATRSFQGRRTVRLTDYKGRRYARAALADEADRLALAQDEAEPAQTSGGRSDG